MQGNQGLNANGPPQPAPQQAAQLDANKLSKPTRLSKPAVTNGDISAELIAALRSKADAADLNGDISVPCGLFKTDQKTTCENILTKLATNPHDETTLKSLSDLTENMIQSSPVTAIVNEVKKINPKVAASILANLGFNSHKVEKTVGNTSVELLVVEDVDSWNTRTKVLDTLAGNQAQPQRAQGLLSRLNPFGQKGGFVPTLRQFLAILVEWVNAPQHAALLNPELQQGPARAVNLNEVDKSFNLYDRKNPQLALRLSDYKTGLKRINLGLSSGTAGYTPSLYTNVPIGMGFNQTLNPEIFFNGRMSALPSMIQVGGDDGETFQQFEQEVFRAQSYTHLKEVNDFFGKVLAANSQHISLSDNSKAKISDALNKLKEGEEELKQSYARFLARRRIYEASRGQVQIADDDDDNETLAKINQYSNFLKRAEFVNKQTKKVTAMLYNLADSITVLIAKPSATVQLQ